MQPSCPVNLADIIRTCVIGWKRDGEWPPRSAPVPAAQPAYLRSDAAATAAAKERSRKAAERERLRMKQAHEAKQARKQSIASLGGSGSRRLSFGALLGSLAGHAAPHGQQEQGGAAVENTAAATAAGADEPAPPTGRRESNSDGAGSGGGKGIRRSLQKVFSLGHGGQHHHHHETLPPSTPAAP